MFSLLSGGGLLPIRNTAQKQKKGALHFIMQISRMPLGCRYGLEIINHKLSRWMAMANQCKSELIGTADWLDSIEIQLHQVNALVIVNSDDQQFVRLERYLEERL